MKEISFRPLRRDKKTGKIIVANYMAWRKVKTANYDPYILKLARDHEAFDPSERVYNHKGEDLFFPAEFDPYKHFMFCENGMYNLFKTDRAVGDGMFFFIPFVDCDGIPIFSHYNIERTSKVKIQVINAYMPLTVEVVTKWLGWLILEMNNAKVIQ